MMKKLLIILFALLYFSVNAQIIDDVPCDPDEFNWEVDGIANPNEYADTWLYVHSDQSVRSFWAPWHDQGAFADEIIEKVFFPEDYTQANGWELVRFDFGTRRVTHASNKSTSGILKPYFILYNKYRSVMRFFIFNASELGIPPYNGVALEIFVNDPGIYLLDATENGNYLSANEMLANPSLNKQSVLIIHNGGDGTPGSGNNNLGPNQWVYFDIDIAFDPYHQNTPSMGVPTLEWTFYHLTEMTVDLTLDADMQTYTDDVKDFDKKKGFKLFSDGPITKTQTTQNGQQVEKIIADGLKFVQEADWDKYANIGSETATNFVSFLEKNGVYEGEALHDLANFIRKITLSESTSEKITSEIEVAKDAVSSVLGFHFLSNFPTAEVKHSKILDLLKGMSEAAPFISTAFDFGKNLFGWFQDKSSNGPNYIETRLSYSQIRGTIEGDINLQSIQESRILGIPGKYDHHDPLVTQNYAYLSYYSCPPGILTLQSTPVITKHDYEHPIGSYWGETTVHGSGFGGSSPQQLYKSFTKSYSSYGIELADADDINILINESSGMQIEKIEYALACDIPKKENGNEYVKLEGYYKPGTCVRQIYINNQYLDLKNNFYSPIVGDMNFNCPGFSHHHYFEQNLHYEFYNPLLYSLEKGHLNFSNFNEASEKVQIQTPYVSENNLAELAMNVPRNAENLRLKVKLVLKSDIGRAFLMTRDYKVNINTVSGPSNNPLFSNLNSNFPDLKTSYSDNSSDVSNMMEVTLNTPTENSGIVDETSFISITMEPGFIAHNGVVFTASIANDGYTIPYHPGLITQSIEPPLYDCDNVIYNPYYHKEGEETITTVLNVSPNPTVRDISISSKETGRIIILDAVGQSIYETQIESQATESMDLSGYPPGIYFVKFDNGTSIETQKIILQ